MPITMNDLTVPMDHLEREAILQDWTWLIGETKFPILFAACGDAFLQDTQDGTVWVLDSMEGALHQVALDLDEFRSLLNDREFVSDYLAVQMIGDLIQEGKELDPGHIYSLTVPVPLGGEVTLPNIEPTDIQVHFSVLGQLHEKIKDLPPGTTIDEVSTD